MTASDQNIYKKFREKRFLFVIGQYTKMGGAERQAIILASELKREIGAHIDFLAWTGDGIVNSTLRNLGIPCYSFPLNWQGGAITKSLSLLRLITFIRNHPRPNYILPYIGFNCKIIGLIWKLCRAQFTWWNQRDEGRDLYGSYLESRVLRTVPGVVSNSFEGRDFLVNRFGLRQDKIAVINNGINLPSPTTIKPWRSKLGIHPEDLLITMVANITAYKDHLTLLRAFAELRKSPAGNRCHLCLAGSHGSNTQAVKALAFDLNLSNCVHLPGDIGDVSELWSSTDLAVHSSKTEGCPNSVLEAMAHKLAVCGTNISGLRQALGEEGNYFLSEPGDHQSLSNIMTFLVKNEEIRRQIGLKNRKRIEEDFNPKRLMTSVLTYIDSKISLNKTS